MPQQRLHLDRNQLQAPRRPPRGATSSRAASPPPAPCPTARAPTPPAPRSPTRSPSAAARRHRNPPAARRSRPPHARRREVGVTVLVHPHPSGVTRRPDRIREVHDLPGVGRVRRRGLLPEPTCRHGGCPLRHSVRLAATTSVHCAPYRLSASVSTRTDPRPRERGADSLCGTTTPVTGHRSAPLRFRDQPSPHRDSHARNPGVSHRPSFRTSHPIWQSVSRRGDAREGTTIMNATQTGPHRDRDRHNR